nr:hypothetical protein [Candidatus Sigynarchaeota archaeon]
LAVNTVMRFIASTQSFFTTSVVHGLYFLLVTARGKQWFDKKRVVAVLGAFGAFHVIVSGTRIYLAFFLYDIGRQFAYSMVYLAMGALAVYASIKAWTYCKRALERNILYHLL